MQLSNELRSMIARRRPGYSLEAPFYRSKDIFDLDMDVIFGKHWIFVGVEPDIPEPGDYFTVPLGRTSIVVARDDDMTIRAFHNVCRHRGERLCDGDLRVADDERPSISGHTISVETSSIPNTWAMTSTVANSV